MRALAIQVCRCMKPATDNFEMGVHILNSGIQVGLGFQVCKRVKSTPITHVYLHVPITRARHADDSGAVMERSRLSMGSEVHFFCHHATGDRVWRKKVSKARIIFFYSSFLLFLCSSLLLSLCSQHSPWRRGPCLYFSPNSMTMFSLTSDPK